MDRAPGQPCEPCMTYEVPLGCDPTTLPTEPRPRPTPTWTLGSTLPPGEAFHAPTRLYPPRWGSVSPVPGRQVREEREVGSGWRGGRYVCKHFVLAAGHRNHGELC